MTLFHDKKMWKILFWESKDNFWEQKFLSVFSFLESGELLQCKRFAFVKKQCNNVQSNYPSTMTLKISLGFCISEQLEKAFKMSCV